MTDNKNIMQVNSIRDLTDPLLLQTFTGPIATITQTQLSAIGYSGSVIERVTVELKSGITNNFILKHTHLEADWLSQRSGDKRGREAAMLQESCLQPIWNMIECPYIAFAVEEKQTGLLMYDYTPNLFPDVREPIAEKDEGLILDRLAAMHASFWNSDALLKTGWLMQAYKYLDILAPKSHPTDQFAPPPDKIRDSIINGWEAAFRLLPAPLIQLMKQPAAVLFDKWKDLPVTLLHGDVKLANMAMVPPGKLVGTQRARDEWEWWINAISSVEI